MTLVESFQLLMDALEDTSGVPKAKWKKALSVYFNDNEKLSWFLQCPASTRYHDCQPGGLIRHTYKVLINCRAVLRMGVYDMDPVLLTTGVLFHDLGKTLCYDKNVGTSKMFANNNEYAKRLGNHLAIGRDMFVKNSDAIMLELGEVKDPDFVQHVTEMIGSHHGMVSNGFGSTCDPISSEAWLLHTMDFFDSRAGEKVVKEEITE